GCRSRTSIHLFTKTANTVEDCRPAGTESRQRDYQLARLHLRCPEPNDHDPDWPPGTIGPAMQRSSRQGDRIASLQLIFGLTNIKDGCSLPHKGKPVRW